MAMDQLNGYEIAGMAIKVGLVNETPNAGQGGDDALDDGEQAGMQLTAASRAQLMQRLQRDPEGAAAAPPPTLPAQTDGLNHDPGCTIAPMPQRCILLRNMFDPRNERNPNFDMEIKEDVAEEVGKYGKVEHIAVDKTSAGFVFVKFDTQQGATAAKSNLENRWFNQKMITCEYLLEEIFTSDHLLVEPAVL